MSRTPSREAIARLAVAADTYRRAFTEVQRLLATLDLGPIPGWVFAIDRLAIEEIQPLSEELLQAESKRRRARTALTALVELIALEDNGDEVDPRAATPPPVDTADQSNLPKLDRFITVINAARAGGCIYVNGGFEPMGRDPMPDPADTFDLPPQRSRTDKDPS